MNKENLASLSLILSLASVGAWFVFPILSMPLSAIGVLYGVQSRQSEKRKLAIAGIIIGVAFLVFAVVYGAYSAYWEEYYRGA